jgi:hypothetical protein
MSEGEGTSSGLWEVENGVGGTYYAHRPWRHEAANGTTN